MLKQILITLLFCIASSLAQAAQWVKLNDSSTSKLMLDKQSVLTEDLPKLGPLKKAWVKMDYKQLQKNVESVEKEYNSAKALWFFDCATQKSTTTQVFQYLNQELVYSAGVEVKSAEFMEPMPDSDVEIAMRYVCKAEKTATHTNKPTEAAPKAVTTESTSKKPESSPAANPTTSEAVPNAVAPNTNEPNTAASGTEKITPPAKKDPKLNAKTDPKKSANASAAWSYEGKSAPEHWGKLTPEYAGCETGRNQSPINIDSTIHAALKPIRAIQKFSAKDMAVVNHALQIDFKKGNMMVLDSTPFQLKHLVLRTPSEHTIDGKGFPLEAQWLHEDAKGNLAYVSVMFKEDKKPHAALDKLLAQLPEIQTKDKKPLALKARILPSDLISQDKRYYRYTGSTTTPPCTEGVRWILMKTPQTASTEQLKALSEAVAHPNARPVQALNGRTVLE